MRLIYRYSNNIVTDIDESMPTTLLLQTVRSTTIFKNFKLQINCNLKSLAWETKPFLKKFKQFIFPVLHIFSTCRIIFTIKDEKLKELIIKNG